MQRCQLWNWWQIFQNSFLLGVTQSGFYAVDSDTINHEWDRSRYFHGNPSITIGAPLTVKHLFLKLGTSKKTAHKIVHLTYPYWILIQLIKLYYACMFWGGFLVCFSQIKQWTWWFLGWQNTLAIGAKLKKYIIIIGPWKYLQILKYSLFS